MKRTFDILTDSACDLSEEFLKENEVICAPLGFTMNNVNYERENGDPIAPKAFYDKLREGAMPTTYQVTGEQAMKYIEPSLKQGNDVLVISFSSGLSGTAGSFIVAARTLAKVYPKRTISEPFPI